MAGTSPAMENFNPLHHRPCGGEPAFNALAQALQLPDQ